MSISLVSQSPSTDSFSPQSYLTDSNHATYLSSVSTDGPAPVSTPYLSGEYTLTLTETLSTPVSLTSIYYDVSFFFPQLDGTFGSAMTYPWDVEATITIAVTNGSTTLVEVNGTYPDYDGAIPLSFDDVTEIETVFAIAVTRAAGTPALQNEYALLQGSYIRVRAYVPSYAETTDPTTTILPLWTHDGVVTCGWVADPDETCGWVADATLPCTVTEVTEITYWDFSMTSLVDFSQTTEAATFDSTNTGADN